VVLLEIGLQQQPDDSRPTMAVLFENSPRGLLHHFYRLDLQSSPSSPDRL
jgi:hypothetical protein